MRGKRKRNGADIFRGAFGRGQRAKSGGQGTEGEEIFFSAFYEGLTPPSLLKCRPKGLFCSGKTMSSSFSGNTGVSFPIAFRKGKKA